MSKQSRRTFLKALGALSAAGVGQFGLNLATLASASADSGGGYKAIVCLFMNGGNDQTNLLVPYDTIGYNAYSNLRQSLALPYGSLVKISPTNVNDGRQFSLHPSMNNVANLFDQGKAALLCNVGTLVTPVTKTQYLNKSEPLPAKLFSHNDQQSTWQSLGPEGASFGWAGRMGDILQSNNSNSIFTCVSASGNTVMLAGNSVRTYPIGINGSTPISTAIGWGYNFNSTGIDSTMRDILVQDSNNLLEKETAAIYKRSMDANNVLSNSLNSAAAYNLPADLNNSSLAKQLRSVARMISVQTQLGMKRQVFFVSLGGFDTHGNQLNAQTNLLGQVSKSLDYFYSTLSSMGLQDCVTTFTASDFGRTGTSNGDGSDHGWGSHHIVMGGAVKGKNMYGTFPTLANNGPDDVGSGRLIPTTSVDQYAATLGSWLGVSDSDLLTILPNLKNFSNRNLGFLS